MTDLSATSITSISEFSDINNNEDNFNLDNNTEDLSSESFFDGGNTNSDLSNSTELSLGSFFNGGRKKYKKKRKRNIKKIENIENIESISGFVLGISIAFGIIGLVILGFVIYLIILIMSSDLDF